MIFEFYFLYDAVFHSPDIRARFPDILADVLLLVCKLCLQLE